MQFNDILLEQQVKYDAAGTSVDSGHNDKLSELIDLLKGIAIKQSQLEEALPATTMSVTQSEGDMRRQTNPNISRVCYTCRQAGVFAKDCRRRQQGSRENTVQCYTFQGFGHVARNCLINLNTGSIKSFIKKTSRMSFILTVAQ